MNRLCCVVVCVIIAAALISGVTWFFWPREKFGAIFMRKCEKFKGEGHKDYCQRLLHVFQQAYVGRDKCEVPMEAYDPLIGMCNFDHPSNQTILWSGTKPFVDKYTRNNPGCFSLDKTLLGFILNDESWYGKKNSNETFTDFQKYDDTCKDNPIDSFWKRLSVQFARYARGEVTAILNGSREHPIGLRSVFALEIAHLRPSSVTHLNVALIIGDGIKQWVTGIRYNCKEISGDDIKKCIADTSKPCGACLF